MWDPNREVVPGGPPPAVLAERERRARLTPEEREREDRAALAQSQRHTATNVARWSAEEEAAERIAAAIKTLRMHGKPGLQKRYKEVRAEQTWWERFRGVSGAPIMLDLEPAWPIGTYAWVSGASHKWGASPTGYTPSGKLVPMKSQSAAESVSGLRQPTGMAPSYAKAQKVTVMDIARALERVVANHCPSRD